MRGIVGSFGVVLIGVVLCGNRGQSAEEYSFVKMWPKLPESWYFDFPCGAAADGLGNVYVLESGLKSGNPRVQKFTSDGVLIARWGREGTGEGEFYEPFDVAADGEGNVYVADTWNQRIQKFNSNGVFIAKWGIYGSGDGELNVPVGVAVDASGNVYVADEGNSRIQKFTSDGVFIAKWGKWGGGNGEFAPLWGLAVDGSGNVYVADTGNARVQKFTSDGVFIAKLGREGRGEGEFDAPYGLAVDGSGNVYVADGANHRIQKFRRSFGMEAVGTVGTWPTIEWDAEPGKSYTVWVAGPTTTGFDWMAVPGTVAASETGISSWTDDGQHPLGSPATAVLRFYRIELLP